MVRWAAVLVLAFLACHLFGMREDVGILSGTLPTTEGGLVSGGLYVMAWFGCVLVAPILVLAAAIHTGLRRAKLIRSWIDSGRR